MILHLDRWIHASPWTQTATLVSLPAAGFLTARVLDHYRAWIALGPGGLPHNVIGYTANLLMTVLLPRLETKTVDLYEQPEKYALGWRQAPAREKARAMESFLDESLMIRDGPEEHALTFMAPQRQRLVDAYMDVKVKKAYLAAFKKLEEDFSDSMDIITSLWEQHGAALALKDTFKLRELCAKCKGEIAHIHESDLSAHVLLSITDAKELVANGYGERHGMNGTPTFL